jgi:hypothetical protein
MDELREAINLVIEIYSKNGVTDVEVFDKCVNAMVKHMDFENEFKNEYENLRKFIDEFWILNGRTEKWSIEQVLGLAFNTLHNPKIPPLLRKIVERD